MFKRKESRKNEEQRFTVSNGRLTVDCKGCKGQSSLCDRNCLLCVCERIVEEWNISSISLRSSIDLAIDGDAVTSIRELAFLHRLLSMNRSERKGKKCARFAVTDSVSKAAKSARVRINIRYRADSCRVIAHPQPGFVCLLPHGKRR